MAAVVDAVLVRKLAFSLSDALESVFRLRDDDQEILYVSVLHRSRAPVDRRKPSTDFVNP
jgi:hypothetical protein